MGYKLCDELQRFQERGLSESIYRFRALVTS